MKRTVLDGTLRERLGEDASRELAEFLERQADTWRDDAVNICSDRFDSRLQDYGRKNDVTEGFARQAEKLAEMKLGLHDAIGAAKIEFLQQLGETNVVLANRLAEMRVEQLR